MSASDTNKPSQTNWSKLDKMTDEEVDRGDIPELDGDFFERATLRMPRELKEIGNG